MATCFVPLAWETEMGVVLLYNYSKDGTLGTNIREPRLQLYWRPGKPLQHSVHLRCDCY